MCLQTSGRPPLVKTQATVQKTGTVYATKRVLSKSLTGFGSERKRLRFQVVQGVHEACVDANLVGEAEPDCGIVVDTGRTSAMRTAQSILHYMRVTAMEDNGDQFEGNQIYGAVITVPAHFSAHQCEVTRVDGQLAGFKDVVLLRAPIAAALSYASRKGKY